MANPDRVSQNSFNFAEGNLDLEPSSFVKMQEAEERRYSLLARPSDNIINEEI